MYAGHTVQGSGDWLLQDDTFTYEKFAEMAKSSDVENALKQQEGGSLDISVFDEGNWKESHMAKQSFAKLLKVQVNPEEKLSDINGVLQFSAYLTFFVKVRTTKDLLKASDVVGNIRFSRPTLYIFPGSQGDSALFGISGFNLLVNGGYSRKSCFWDFTRHLDRIDAVVNTHLGADNFMGVSSVLERKAADNVHPEIGFMYMNAVEKSKHSPNGDAQPENGGSHKPASLLVSLVEEGNKIVANLKQLGQSPSPCLGRIVGNVLEPLTLYHKVGHGTLDMFVLNPLQDNKEVKEFLSQWNKDVNNFSMVKASNRGGNIPLPNMVSICALLVWRPSVQTEKITRILFPGSAPQSRIFEGLDKLKNMDIFQHETCSEKSLHAPKATNRKAAGAKPAARAPTPRSTPAPKAEPKKAPEKKPPAKVEKGAKEETNKKALEKKTKKSPTSSKSTTPASITPSQSASEVSSPQQDKAPSPVAAPKEAWPEEKKPEAPAKVPTPEAVPELQAAPAEAEVHAEEASKPEADQVPSAVPEPAPLVDQHPHSPEPLPDPMRFDNAPFDSTPAPAAPVEEAMPEPQKAAPVEAALPDFTIPEPLAKEPEPLAKEPELPSPVEPEAPTESLLSFDEPKGVPEPQIKPVEVEAVEAVRPSKLEPTSPGLVQDDKQSLEDLGIYDDEKDVDTAEITHSAASQASSQAADDQGLGDDDPESLQSPPTEPLIDMGFSEKVEAEQVVATEAAPAEVAPQSPVTAQSDGAGSQHPEADQMVFGGAAPEGLPEPAEPVLEPEMSKEQDFLDQIQQGGARLKDADMPPVPEPDVVAALSQEQLAKSPEVETAPEPEQAAPEPEQRVQSPEIELAEEPKPEEDQAPVSPQPPAEDLAPSPEPTRPVEPVELAAEPQVDAASDLEVAQEPALLPEVDRPREAAPLTPEPEVEVELAQKAELMPEDSALHQAGSDAHDESFSDSEPLELAAKADEDTTAPTAVPEPAIEAEEAGQPDECRACDERKLFPDEPKSVEEAEEAAEVAEPTECGACDDRKMFPEEKEEPTEPVVSSPEPQSPVEEAQEAAESAEDLECKACDDRKLFPDEPPAQQSVSPQPMEVEEKESPKDGPASPIGEEVVAPQKVGQLECSPEDRDVSSPELPEPFDAIDAKPAVEESLVEHGTAEKLQVAELEDLPTPSEPSLSEHLTATDHDEDSSAYDKEHDGDDDSLQQQHSAMETSLEGALPASNNPFEIVDGPTRPTDPMSMSFFDDGGSQSTNPFLGMDGSSCTTGLPAEALPTIPHTTNGLTQDQNQNPFDMAPSVTPAVQALQREGVVERDSLEREEEAFDPLKEWGQPMGLPAPAPPAEKGADKKEAATKRPAGAARKVDPRKSSTGTRGPPKKTEGDDKTGAAKKEAPKRDPIKKEPMTPRKEAIKKEPIKKESPKKEAPKPKNGPTATLKNGTTKEARHAMPKPPAAAAVKKEAPKLKKAPRPATAPVKTESAKSEAAKRESPRPTPSTKRPATASKAAPPKAPTPTPVVPFYVDLTYVPCHGDMHYVDLDFFRRVRARYYVISALNPSPGVLNALLEAKQMWENPEAEVTLIPTYDTETLRHWMGLHRDQLSQLKIDVAPSASRCTIQLQDHETSCAAYRLEF